eukprot:CAMPEP_0173188550 /NCGR_PEP_ID=MMETSP1141-20130122/11313_1 /TAXON_ID=483371 /ORGANISM="non described non described, Strain CCMP2298" /LENGTH=1064 /DNA_ID=CAMNT_0014112483 /DNA_START=39 /DNA_END=3233 /DNA_ORIENTATION=-
MNRSNAASLKPEYVLKRVNDLINSAVGTNAEKEKRLALEQLHSVIGVRRKGVWNKFFEQLMKKHLELCVDLKDHLTAKDGLHQYRNLCQTVDPGSLEIVIVHLVELAESRATAARAKADKVALMAAARVSDLDQEETPESIMLSSMTEEGAKDRTDREVVVPWLKFLWESYRAILELLYKIPKLEKVYHKTCEKAFKFCSEYHRVLEFRRLCDMLRMQLANLQKTPSVTARNRQQWEWTPEAVELHLQTRFSQLEVATSLELWNEGYRTVEDIYAIMVAGKKTPKPKLMMTYYDKLQRIFWVSDNKLFHAYACFRYYVLCCETRKDLKAEEKSIMASSVLLSALTVPAMRDAAVDDDQDAIEKNSPMAMLLDFQSNPSRQTLLAEIAAKGVLADVLPELLALYENLEVKLKPLALVQKISAAMTVVKEKPALAIYAVPLQRVAVVKLMQQLGRVYSSIKLDFLYKLLAGKSELSPNAIERILIEGVALKQLQLRINHSTRSIQFASSSAGTSVLDSQVSQLGSALNKVSHSISLSLGQETLEAQKAAARGAFLSKVAKAAEAEFAESLDRKAQIERRKEGLERVQQERAKEAQRVKEEEEAHRKVEEENRLELEEVERNNEKRKKASERMELLRMQKELERHGVVMEEAAIAELDSTARRALITDAQKVQLKAKEKEEEEKAKEDRKLDHITRALRIEGAEKVAQRYKDQVEEDRLVYEAKLVEFFAKAEAKHAADLTEKKRLEPMQPLREAFEGDLVATQRAAHERYVAKMKAKMLKDRTEQAVARARRLANEEEERAEREEEEEREREAAEEAERLEIEQAERIRVGRQHREEENRVREEKMRKSVEEAEEATRKKREEIASMPAKPAAYAPPARPAPVGADSRFGGGDRDPREGGDRFRREEPRGGRDEPMEGGDRDWGRGSARVGGGRDEPRERAPMGDRGGPMDRRGDRPERGGDDGPGAWSRQSGGDRQGGDRQERPAPREGAADGEGRWGGGSRMGGAPQRPPMGDRGEPRNSAPAGDGAVWRGGSQGSRQQSDRPPATDRPAPSRGGTNSRASGGW